MTPFPHLSLPCLVLTGAVLLSACSPAAQNDNGRVPGGTNQQDAINQAGPTNSSNVMPGVGAPGTGGVETQ